MKRSKPFSSNRPVRILYVDTGIDLAGGQYSLLEILKPLDRSRFFPIVSSPEPSAIKLKCGEIGVDWLPLPFESTHLTSHGAAGLHGKIRDLVTSLYGVFSIAHVVRKHHIDIVHANTFKAALVCGFASLLTMRPIVFHDRVHIAHQPLGWLVALVAKRIIAVSHSVGSKHRGYMSRKLRVIPPGIDVSALTPARTVKKTKIICSLGRISEEKAIDKLVESAAMVLKADPEIRFVVGGAPFTTADQTYFGGVQRRVDELGISDRFEFAGYVEDTLGFLRRCDLLVLPSHKEPLGRVMLEAMAVGKPVVAFDSGGPKEVIRDGETGFLVRPDSPEDLADRMLELIRDPQLCRRMGQNARQVVVSVFSSTVVTDRIMKVYDEICHGH